LLNIKSFLHGKNCKNDIHGGDSFFESYDNRFSIDIISAQDFSFNDKYMLSKLWMGVIIIRLTSSLIVSDDTMGISL